MILGQGSLAKKFALRFKVGRKQQPLTDRERDIVTAARVRAPSQAHAAMRVSDIPPDPDTYLPSHRNPVYVRFWEGG